MHKNWLTESLQMWQWPQCLKRLSTTPTTTLTFQTVQKQQPSACSLKSRHWNIALYSYTSMFINFLKADIFNTQLILKSRYTEKVHVFCIWPNALKIIGAFKIHLFHQTIYCNIYFFFTINLSKSPSHALPKGFDSFGLGKGKIHVWFLKIFCSLAAECSTMFMLVSNSVSGFFYTFLWKTIEMLW